jgi:hypothetical protein
MKHRRHNPGDLVVVDGIRGRVVDTSLARRRRERQRRLFMHLGWEEVAEVARALGLPYTMRLWLALKLQTDLGHSKEEGWIKPRRQLLDQIGLPPHSRHVIARLERSGMIEVQRPPGKRVVVRLKPAKERRALTVVAENIDRKE